MDKLTPDQARSLLATSKSLTPAEWIALSSFVTRVGLAFMLEEQSTASLERDAIFNRADEVFLSNGVSLAGHIEQYRAAQGK